MLLVPVLSISVAVAAVASPEQNMKRQKSNEANELVSLLANRQSIYMDAREYSKIDSLPAAQKQFVDA